jgi:hypothetical protein
MELYRPFLYVDLDTAIVQSIETIFDLVKDESQFIVLEDFYQKRQLATGLVWFPANSPKIKAVWDNRHKADIATRRMDVFLRQVVTPDLFWQQLTDGVVDFKPATKILLDHIPDHAKLICFHGKPRIREAQIEWVKKYVQDASFGY